jgi:hypothetical protein
MNIDPQLPFGIKFNDYQQTLTSYEDLKILLDDFLKGPEARKWNLRLYVTRDVANKLISLENNLSYEVIYSIKDVHPKLADLVMVHFSTFSRDPDSPKTFLAPEWHTILNMEMRKLKSPVEVLNYYFAKNPKNTFSKEFTPEDETELRYFIENVFGSNYEKFITDMRDYEGLISCVRDANGKIIAMANALKNEFNGLIHYEIDHAASTQIGLGAAIAAIGLIAQILERNPMAIITSEIKLDLVQGALVLGLTIPPIPNSDLNLYSVDNPLQLIRKQVTIGETQEYFDLLFMVLRNEQIQNYYSEGSRSEILGKYDD